MTFFFRQTEPFLMRFSERNVFEGIQQNGIEKRSPKRQKVLILMQMKPQDYSLQQAEPAEYSNCRRGSRFTLWKAGRVRFCHIFPRELDDQNFYWFSRSTTYSTD